jgi:glycosyltransferase involved in cell wall biosynthesis
MRGTLGSGQTRLILQNPDDADAFVASRLVPPRIIRVIRGSGVDTGRFRPAGTTDVDRRPLRVLLAARLVWEKGIREFVDAAALLKAQGRQIEFLLAGMPDPGNPHSVGREHVDLWQRQGLVRWLGHVDDMPALLPTVDVMALPSYYREGVPRSLLEGAACGLALVTTDLPGCREIVARHGVDGLHATPRDPESLASLLASLDDDRDLLRTLGDNARRNAVAEFDERQVIAETIAVYAELLGAPSGASRHIVTDAARG